MVNGSTSWQLKSDVSCVMSPVIIAEIAIPDKVDDGANATWTCKRCKAVNG
jgi:hypothetical protein